MSSEKVIIFDFNRTLYDPEKELLVPDTLEILATCQMRGFSLILVSRGSYDRRELIRALGIDHYFDEVIIVKEKTQKLFTEVLQRYDGAQIYIVGDLLRSEIRYGNIAGAETIWIRRGEFSDYMPQDKFEEPNHVISSLKYLPPIISA